MVLIGLADIGMLSIMTGENSYSYCCNHDKKVKTRGLWLIDRSTKMWEINDGSLETLWL